MQDRGEGEAAPLGKLGIRGARSEEALHGEAEASQEGEELCGGARRAREASGSGRSEKSRSHGEEKRRSEEARRKPPSREGGRSLKRGESEASGRASRPHPWPKRPRERRRSQQKRRREGRERRRERLLEPKKRRRSASHRKKHRGRSRSSQEGERRKEPEGEPSEAWRRRAARGEAIARF